MEAEKCCIVFFHCFLLLYVVNVNNFGSLSFLDGTDDGIMYCMCTYWWNLCGIYMCSVHQKSTWVDMTYFTCPQLDLHRGKKCQTCSEWDGGDLGWHPHAPSTHYLLLVQKHQKQQSCLISLQQPNSWGEVPSGAYSSVRGDGDPLSQMATL